MAGIPVILAQQPITPDQAQATAAALGLFGLVLVGVGAVCYFIPTAIALFRHKSNSAAIALVNIFLGWTFIGWIVALVWAVSNESVDRPVVVRTVPTPAAPPPASALCASCGKYSHAGTKFCPHCGAAMAT